MTRKVTINDKRYFRAGWGSNPTFTEIAAHDAMGALWDGHSVWVTTSWNPKPILVKAEAVEASYIEKQWITEQIKKMDEVYETHDQTK
jgi:hypothetical protein